MDKSDVDMIYVNLNNKLHIKESSAVDMVYVNLNNKLLIKESSVVDMVKDLRNPLHYTFYTVGFSNDKINDIFISSHCQ